MRPLTRLAVLLFALPLLASAANPPPRERVSFNAGWRFHPGEDNGPARPQLDYATSRPWLLASSVDLLGAGTVRPDRPAGNFAGEVGETKPGFDDSQWRQLDLPHDWGIEGPFRYEYPGDTGKLKFWGNAWYRKHFTVPESEAGRSVSLEVDGAM